MGGASGASLAEARQPCHLPPPDTSDLCYVCTIPPSPLPPPPQLYYTLKRYADASVRHLDNWRVTLTAPDASLFAGGLPYALQAAEGRVSATALRRRQRCYRLLC